MCRFLVQVNNLEWKCFNNRRRRDYQGYGVTSLSPDNDVFLQLAKIYADNHRTMKNPQFQCRGDSFTDGITNGAYWYNVRGNSALDLNFLVIIEVNWTRLICENYANTFS